MRIAATAGRTLTIALLLAASAAAQEPAADPPELEIRFVEPGPGQPLLGAVAVEVEVRSPAAVRSVEIRLDGELIDTLTAPPWRLEIDVGGENRDRQLTAVASDTEGRVAAARLDVAAIRIDEEVVLELQQLYASVTRAGAPVGDLDRTDFEIVDGGERQTIVTFERGDVPLTVAILLDTSFSMKGEHLAAALAGVRSFLADMRELDEAKLFVFSDRTLAATPWTSDPDELTRLLPSLDGRSGTTVNDHLYLAIGQLEAREGRRVVVLLSDGIDVESVLEAGDVLWKAGRSRALVYWIRTRPDAGGTRSFFSAWRDPDAHRVEIAGLEELVRTTGGRVFPVQSPEDAPAALGKILGELRSQYVFGYYPTVDRDDGSWREVTVRVRSGAEVRTRRGYYDSP